MATVEERLEKLEKEIAELTTARTGPGLTGDKKPGWTSRIAGSFQDDPEFDEVLRLGREDRKLDLVNGE